MTSRSPRRMPTSSKVSERAETRGASWPGDGLGRPVVVALVRLRVLGTSSANNNAATRPRDGAET